MFAEPCQDIKILSILLGFYFYRSRHGLLSVKQFSRVGSPRLGTYRGKIGKRFSNAPCFVRRLLIGISYDCPRGSVDPGVWQTPADSAREEATFLTDVVYSVHRESPRARNKGQLSCAGISSEQSSLDKLSRYKGYGMGIVCFLIWWRRCTVLLGSFIEYFINWGAYWALRKVPFITSFFYFEIYADSFIKNS